MVINGAYLTKLPYSVLTVKFLSFAKYQLIQYNYSLNVVGFAHNWYTVYNFLKVVIDIIIYLFQPAQIGVCQEAAPL